MDVICYKRGGCGRGIFINVGGGAEGRGGGIVLNMDSPCTCFYDSQGFSAVQTKDRTDGNIKNEIRSNNSNNSNGNSSNNQDPEYIIAIMISPSKHSKITKEGLERFPKISWQLPSAATAQEPRAGIV